MKIFDDNLIYNDSEVSIKYWQEYWKTMAEYLYDIGELHINDLNKDNIINIFIKGAEESQKIYIDEIQKYLKKYNMIFEENLRLNKQLNELSNIVLKLNK